LPKEVETDQFSQKVLSSGGHGHGRLATAEIHPNPCDHVNDVLTGRGRRDDIIWLAALPMMIRAFIGDQTKYISEEYSSMGLDLLPILPRALPSGSAVEVVGQRTRSQQHCQNGRFFLLIQCL
jgi:hypothetical protein